MTPSPASSNSQLQAAQENLLHRITNRIRQSLQLQEILQTTVTEIREFLMTDRVMIYRFHPDEHGEVIAEAIAHPDIPTLLGLHFPAEDIPPYSRELFLQARQRSIVDLASERIGWSAPPLLDEVDDTTDDIRYAPVDPCHIEYLLTMGVQSSVVVPILQEDHLWGLLVAHHSESRSVVEADLQFLQLVVDQVTIAIAQSALLSQVQAQAQREQTANRIATLLHSEVNNPLGVALKETVAALGGSGGRLLLLPGTTAQPSEVYACGTQPQLTNSDFLEHHLLWQNSFLSGELAISDLYQDDRCRSLQTSFQSTPIRSLLIVPLQQGAETVGCLTLFRDEIETETLWAGKINPDVRQTMPRQSFERWRQHKNGQVQDWTEADLNLVETIKTHFALAIGQYQLQTQIQSLNVQLQEQVQHQSRDLANIQYALDQSAIVAITDNKGIITYVNDKFCDVSQYDRHELIGKSHRCINSGHHPKQFFTQLWQTITKGEVWQGEIKNRAKDGTEYWVATTIVPLLDEQEQPDEYVAIHKNINARKQAEIELLETRQFLESVLQTLPIAVVLKDAQNLRFTMLNSAASELFGITQAEVVGKNDYDLFPKLQADVFTQADRAVLSSNQVLTIEAEEIEIKGETRILSTKKTAILDVAGKPKYLVAMTEDITDRKAAEAALRQKAEQEQVLNHLANQVRSSLDIDQILETAVASIRELLQVDRTTFVWYRPHANPPTWECLYDAKLPELPSVLGLYPSDSIGSTAQRLQNLETLQDDDVTAISDPRWQEVLHSLGFKSNIAIPIQTSTGEIGVLSCCYQRSLHPWNQSEVQVLTAVANQLAIAINQANLYKQSRLAAETAQAQAQQLEQALEELRQTQAQLVQTEKMSSLGQLVAGVAHEINNPVNFIYGNLSHAGEYAHDLLNLLELYQQHYPQPVQAIQAEAEEIDLDFLKEDLPKLLASMKIGADRIQKIVLALRTFSRMDEAEVKAVNLHEGIDSTLMILQNRLKEMAGHPGIQVIKNYGALPPVECYAGQLNQVFMNIISNAIDALDEFNDVRSAEELNRHPATITIATEQTSDRLIQIRITDNGPGMTEQVQRRLFEPFFTTKPVGKGTGLGLSISYQVVVDKHGGTLTCQSIVGEGSQFMIELPIALNH